MQQEFHARVAPIRLRHLLKELREKEARQLVAGELPTQETGSIRPIRLARLPNTGPIPVSKPPDVAVMHIASIHPPLLNVNPIRAQVVLRGFRTAYMNQYIELADATYRVIDIWINPTNAGEVMARLEKVQGDE